MKNCIALACFLYSVFSFAQQIPIKDSFAHTFSIVARDAETGEMAVGVQSHWFSVGSVVPWGKSGVGVVATQSFVSERYGYEGLQLLEQNYTPKKALEKLKQQDQAKSFRQVAILDAKGEIAVHTGQKCIAHAQHKIGDNFSVQANMMLNETVIEAMYETFIANSHLNLAERIIEVLKAAEQEGGDIRGKQSAALIVVGAKKSKQPWNDKRIDLRVDDHKTPIKELERLLKVHRAYDYMNQGDVAMEKNNIKAALEAYSKAEALEPTNLEMKFWKAVALANSGDVKTSVPIFERIFEIDKNWQRLLKRLPDAELLTIDEKALNYLLNL
ncbi:MAG: DUF1028 domain-containing protein [Psychroflexus salarius]